jgi:hypothetical protein
MYTDCYDEESAMSGKTEDLRRSTLSMIQARKFKSDSVIPSWSRGSPEDRTRIRC